ncbi:Sodium/calcium exchanger protein-domain-containing protein [Umbelopsis sp. AD052]|nr:Sodium/calcium exchanger protein-domain-containing protein [Umbelopsis sp. AD052]
MMQEQPTSPDQKLTARTLSWKRDQTNGEASSVNNVVSSPDEVEAEHEEEKKKRWIEPTASQGFNSIIRSSWLNVLVVFIPVGIASHFMAAKGSWPATIPFIFNFIAIVPLAKLLGFATEDLSLRVGEVLGGLLNATFGNAVELIVSIIALIQGLITVVQASMLGSILSNLLLVLGMCFFFGGIKYKEQSFNVTAAQTSASLLFIATSSLLLPAAFYGSAYGLSNESKANVTNEILSISRATSIIMLIIYAAFLFFQLKTHKSFFLEAPKEAGKFERSNSRIVRTDTEAGADNLNEGDEEEEEAPLMPLWMSIVLLAVITVLVAVCAEFLVDAITDVCEAWGVSQTFVGLVLLPIVGNAAEHVTAVTVAIKNKMDLALGVAVGSSMQIALLVTPLMVIIGWIIGQPMSLYFNLFETAVMVIAVLMVNYLIMDGKSNWLEGLMLFCVYIIIAIAIFYYPESAGDSLSTGTNSTST